MNKGIGSKFFLVISIILLGFACGIVLPISFDHGENKSTKSSEVEEYKEEEKEVEKIKYADDDFPFDVKGGENNYEHDENIIRQAYWDGKYNGELTMTPNGHLISFDEDGRIWVDNYSMGYRNKHYNPKNYPDDDYSGVDVYSDEKGAWLLMMHSTYTDIKVKEAYRLAYWSKGKLIKEIVNEDMILFTQKELNKLKGLALTPDIETQLFDGRYLFETYKQRAAVIDLETEKVTSLGDDIIDVQIGPDAIDYIRQDHNVYQITIADPLHPILVASDEVRFKEAQSEFAEISEEDLHIFNIVEEASHNDYDGSFTCLADITHSKKDSDTYVLIDRRGKWLVINNRDTRLYIDRCNDSYKFTDGANLYVSPNHKYSFYANNGRLHMATRKFEKEFDVPEEDGYKIVSVHENYDENWEKIKSYSIVLEVYNYDGTSDAYYITISSKGKKYSSKEIVKGASDIQVGIRYNNYNETIPGYVLNQNFKDYTELFYYLDDEDSVCKIELPDDLETKSKEKVKDNADSLRLDDDY